MDEDDDERTVAVRADVARFTQDIAEMRQALEGPLVAGADKAGRAIEAGLLRAVRSGKLGFEDLGRVALSILAQIASAAVRQGLGALGLGGGGLPGLAGGLLAGASSGQVMPAGGGAGRDVHVSITVNGGGAEAPRALARSARQVARAVRGALAE